MTSCELNQIFLGEVASVQNYGAFVRIPGCKQQGLIHKSQVSAARVDDVADVLRRGERIWCKVISIGEDGKVALSMKHVNQGDGRDLDPNGVQQEIDERRRKATPRTKRKVIELEAVLDTTCVKCGTRGHLAADCFVPPDGKKYRLLSEEPEEEAPPRQDDNLGNKEERKISASSKKAKKKKRLKKSRRRSNDSSDEESAADGDENERQNSDERDRKRKKKKKKSKESRPKERKSSSGRRRRREASTSEDESSETSPGNRGGKPPCGNTGKKAKKCKHSRSKYSD